MTSEFTAKAAEYATSLPSREEEAYARAYAAHLLGAEEPETGGVPETRAAAIRAMVTSLRGPAGSTVH